jgi:hypothetical protein
MAIQALRKLLSRVLPAKERREAHKAATDAMTQINPAANGLAKAKAAEVPKPGRENGTAVLPNGKATTPAEPPESSVPDARAKMWRVCEQVDADITEFLRREECSTTQDLKGLQERVKESLKVVEEALGRYRFVFLLSLFSLYKLCVRWG